MPPRRAKRARQAVHSPPPSPSKALDLPLELLMEVVSHLPPPAVTTTYFRSGYYDRLLPASSLERTDTLRAMSQTCKSWRRAFMPILWENLEVCSVRFEKAAWWLPISRALETKCLGIAQSPEQAAHVRTMRVVLTRCSKTTVLPSFASCLLALPNLHTLHVLFAHKQMTTAFKDAFEGRSFPSVRTAVLPTHAHNILRCLPEVRRVVCNFDDGSQLVTAVAKACKKVEVLEGFRPDENMMKRIIKAVPNLHTIRFSYVVSPSAIQQLEKSKHLSVIELYRYGSTEENDALTRRCIDASKEVLRKRGSSASLSIGNGQWSKPIDI